MGAIFRIKKEEKPSERSLYDCYYTRVRGNYIYCQKGHTLHDYHGKNVSVNIQRLARGAPLVLNICQKCADFESMGEPLPSGERGWNIVATKPYFLSTNSGKHPPLLKRWRREKPLVSIKGKTIRCSDCGIIIDFQGTGDKRNSLFTGNAKIPKRCQSCRAKKKMERYGDGDYSYRLRSWRSVNRWTDPMWKVWQWKRKQSNL